MALDNNNGVVGVVQEPKLHIVRVFGPGPNCDWCYHSVLAAAINECINAKANIINMSLGSSAYSSTIDQATKDAYDDGILLIAAAGNGGGTSYLYPASYDRVVSVAAVDINKQVASFSQQNNQVELAAPGVDVKSTTPNNKYENKSGTSMASKSKVIDCLHSLSLICFHQSLSLYCSTSRYRSSGISVVTFP